MSPATLPCLAEVVHALVVAAVALPSPCVAQTFAAVDSIVNEGTVRGIYPGAVVVIGRRGTVLYARGYGHFTWKSSSRVPDPDSTLWDLASLTKVVGTTAAMMLLVQRGQVDLDASVSRYLPRFSGGRKAEVTVRMLLDHTSGLPSYVEFFRLASTRDSAISLLYAEPLRRRPGASAEYSDLNAMLAGLLIEQVAGVPLDRFTAGEVFGPLRMETTMYRPPRELRDRIAPTGEWAGQPVAGVVNDQNAVRLGEVAGHAGVFSSGADLARYAQMWLGEGALPHASGRFVQPEVVRRFLTPSAASGTRVLGWETPDSAAKAPTPYGSLLSRRAFGHTGWTGTEIWIDPGRDLFLVFLTNRCYDPRLSHSIRELRQLRYRLSDAVVQVVERLTPLPSHQ